MHEQIFFPAFLRRGQYCSFSHCTASRVYPQLLGLHVCFRLNPSSTIPAPGQATAGPGFPVHLCQSASLQLQVAETGIRINFTWLRSNVALCPAKPLTRLFIVVLLARSQHYYPDLRYPVKKNYGEDVNQKEKPKLLKEISIIFQYS